MAIRSIIRGLIRPAPTIIFVMLLFIAVVLLAASSQYASRLSNYFSILFLLNIVGAGILIVIILANLYRLINDIKKQTLGSRLTLRLLITYGLLALIPLAIVYAFSIKFLNESIDSWYDGRIEKALDNALLIGRSSMEAVKSDLIISIKEDIDGLFEPRNKTDLFNLLDEIREKNDLTELSIFSYGGRIIASSHSDATVIIPEGPDERMLGNIRRGEITSQIEPIGNSALKLRIMIPMPSLIVGQERQFLQVLYQLPFRFATVGDSLEKAVSQYNRLLYLRRPIKLSFIMTLTLITLLTGLTGLWVAIFSSKKLISPLKDLAIGTQAIASGDYSKQLPVTSNDELGILVRSFNEMTKEIKQTREQEQQAQRKLEDQHAYLETVLKRLSSGVISFDINHKLVTANEATKDILRIDITNSKSSISALIKQYAPIAPLFKAIKQNMNNTRGEWQKEIQISGEKGRQILNVRGSRLAIEDLLGGGLVVVFDDMTNLIQAQRNAAWGEVAQRLAHEIKNPLTPIALSTERVRNKFMDKLQGKDRETLDRATSIIANQVQSLKSMVNEFSDYARPVKIKLQSVDLNQLIVEVLELYKNNKAEIDYELQLQKNLPMIQADISRLLQVLNNLIINAHDSLENVTSAKIIISTRVKQISHAQFVELKISDNGQGFDSDLIDRIFEPYVTTKPQGSGLGLAIVKRIIDEHDGIITLKNLNQSGAQIIIELPLVVKTNYIKQLESTNG